MKKYLIKRNIDGASSIPQDNLDQIGKSSESVLQKMRAEGKQIEQEHSYIAGDSVFCVYNAASENLIKEHAQQANVPVNEVTEITNILKHNTNK